MYIKRERYLSKIRPFYDVDLIKVLTGVRRCGKSILLEQIKEEFIENGFDRAHIIAQHFRFAVDYVQFAVKGFEQARFPRTYLPDQIDELSFVQFQIDIAQYTEFLLMDFYVFILN